MNRTRGRLLWASAAIGTVLAFGIVLPGGLASAASGVLAGSPSSFESGDGNMTVEATGAAGDSDWNCFIGSRGFVAGTPPTCNSNLIRANATQQTADAGGESKLKSGSKFNDACLVVTTSNTPPKDDFTNVAEYNETASNNDIWFYGAAIRATNNGNASGNVEFNQNTSGCRTAGDKLLAYEFLSGGTSLTFHVLTWITSSAGGTCFSGTTFPCWRDDGGAPSTEFNGESNQSTIAGSDNGINGQVEGINQFMEFGTDLTKLLGLTGCVNFPQNVFESRSSGSSFTSNPEDIEIEQHSIDTCTSSTVTTPESGSGAAITSISIGGGSVNVEDKAVVTIGGGATAFGGSVTFHLCGPSDLTSQTTCATGGTLVGAAKAVSPPTPATVTSDQAAVTAAGNYCWRADYSGDSTHGIPASSDSSAGECFTVTPVSPTLATTLHDGTTGASQTGTTPATPLTVSIGDTVYDTASLTGAATGPANGATISYAYYTDSACTQNKVDETPAPSTFTSGGSVPQSRSVTFQNAGTFWWQAVYSGDVNNKPATSPCNEELVVLPINPTMTTAQNLLPNDSATITGATATAGGTVTFNLFAPTDSQCASKPAYSQTVNVSGNGTYSTTNATFHVTAVGEWRWQVIYSGDGNNTGTTSSCGVENFTLTNG